MKKNVNAVITVAVTLLFAGVSFGQDSDLPPDVKAKLDAKIAIYKAWETEPEIVKAVKDYNMNPPAQYKDMTNDKWKTLTILSPEVRELAKTPAILFIKSHKDSSVTEGFISSADGSKVGFLSKTTSWCHKGKPKHDVPMTGKIWIGKIEVDESTGIQAVQVGFPVLDGTKVIGSIVLGFCISKLGN